MTNDNINHNNITMNNHTTSHNNMSSSSATSTPQASSTSSFIPSTRWLSLSNKLSNLSLSASWSGHGFPGLSRSSPFYPSVTNPSSVKSIFYDSSPGTSNAGFIDILKINPEDIAGQLTLIDLPIFQSISEDEFLSIGWNTARKSILSPNIVSLTRRFNQISFWVIEEVLLSSVNRRFSSGGLGDNNDIFVTEKDTSKSSTTTPFVPITENGSNNGDPSSTNNSQHNTYCLLSQSVNVGERGSPKHLKWHSTSSSLQSSPLSASHNYTTNSQNGNQHQQSTLDSEAKLRSDIISHFVKIAKKLHDLHNLHSCYAIVSALTSTPIYRLSKTWALVSKKDKAILDKLTALFADESNFENLRAHLAKTDPPCIPYLGMFLRDLVYVDIAHPAPKMTVGSSATMSVTSLPASDGIVNGNRDTRSTTATLGMSSRMNKMNSILNNITKYQKSSVYHIERIPALSEYLSSVRYIEELQKFLEEDNFKLSLRLEPPTPSIPDKDKEQLSRSTSSYQSVGSKSTFYIPSAAESRISSLKTETTTADKATYGTNGCNNSYHPLQQQETSVNTSTNTEVTADAQEQEPTKPPFVPGHRKTRSLGSQALLQAVGIDLSKPIGHSSPRRGLFGANKPFSLLREDKKVYPSKMNNLSSSDNCPQQPMTFYHHQRRNLIDDSVIEEVPGESEWERSSRSSKASSMVDDGYSISSYSPTPSTRSSTRYRDSTKGEEDRVSRKSNGNMNQSLPSHNRQHHNHATKWNTNDSYKQATTGTGILTSSMESNDREVSEEKLPSITESRDHEKQTNVSHLSPYPCSQGQANGTNGITSSEDRIRISKEDFPDSHRDSLDGRLSPPSFQGYVRRKTLVKEGQKPAFACWIRYWISLRGITLVYYPSRAMKGTTRDRFRETHSKTLNISEWTAQISVTDADSFTLSSDRGQPNSSRKTVYLFRCSSEEEATMWCKHVSKTNSNLDKKSRRSKCDGGPGNGVALTVSRKVIDDDSEDEKPIKHSRRQMSSLQPPQYNLV